MNWLKKLFKTTDEEYIEEVELEEEVVEKQVRQSKTPFRFPLISDHEKQEILHGRTTEYKREIPVVEKEREKDPFYERETIFPAPPRKRETVIPIQPKLKPKPIYQQPIPSNKPETTTVTKRRPFTPTEVPSPIYGFKRPSQREELNKWSVEEESVTNPIDIPSLKQETETIEKTITAKSSIEVSVAEIDVKPAIVPVELEEKEEKTEEVVPQPIEIVPEQVEIVPEQVEIIADRNMQKNPGLEEVAVTHVEELTAEDVPLEVKPEEPKKKENIRPFNVLMLKSDKEKLNKLENRIKNIDPVSPGIRSIPNSTPIPVVQEAKEIKDESLTPTYQTPSFSYLLPPEQKDEDKEWMEEQANTLIEALSYFQVTGEIIQVVQGPAVTQFELTVGHGTKVSKIRNLSDDLKLALAAKDIRIQAPIPGKSSIGIEIPNRRSRAVRISEVLNTETFKESDSPLEAALGLDLTGKPLTLDLRKMPHGLIAGATGSGKSVFINSLLISLLYKARPDELKLMLIDPKMVELAPYNHIPHLVSPVITDVKAATAALKWAVDEMERRYQLFAHIGVRDISRYNTLATEKRQFAQKLPYLVIVIDELADLMMMAPADVEDAICRIAQKARACGIHLVLATQRPSVDVITGLIKANVPTRVAFSVSSQIDSRTILDQQGAERLLGKGDMLYQGNGMSSPIRVQGTYVSDEEIERIIEYARTQGEPEYLFEQEELLQKAEVAEQDDLFEEACRFVVDQGSASTSLLQRKFHLGYNRAARLITAMEECGYISEQRGSKAREVILSSEKLDEIFS